MLFQISTLWKTNVVHAQRLCGWEEQVQERAVAAGMDLRLHSPNTLLLPEDLPFPVDQLPHVFTAFRTRVERSFRIGDLHAEPDRIPAPRYWGERLPEPEELPFIPCPEDPRAALHVRGGRAAGLARLNHYLWKSRALSTYKETRNGLLGADYSSKFSPWLASGALSAREVFHAVKRYESEHGANEITYWLIFELFWRDFFQFTAAKHGAKLFLCSGIARKSARGDHDAERFAAWCQGRTGQPFIDANMRELAATGWMSNRGRQNVASYLVNDLQLDRRMGAYWFERLLIDYDPCSNWGNWQYLAGVGNDPARSKALRTCAAGRDVRPGWCIRGALGVAPPRHGLKCRLTLANAMRSRKHGTHPELKARASTVQRRIERDQATMRNAPAKRGSGITQDPSIPVG